jgi:hypothetical protein
MMRYQQIINSTVALLLLGSWTVQARSVGQERVSLIDSDFSAWHSPTGDWVTGSDVSLNPNDDRKLAWKDGTGAAVNGPQGRTRHLVTRDFFGDVHAHLEFLVSKGSNSGVYFMGRYEIQVFDSWQQQGAYPGIECGGIYERWDESRNPKGFDGHEPLVNVSLPPGQWQSFDVVFRAPRFDAQGNKISNAAFIEVKHNGKRVHKYTELAGPTRASLYNDEKPTGPIMLQGDHGPVAYRNCWIQPIDLDKGVPPNPFFSFHNGIRPAGDGSPAAQARLLKELGYHGAEHSGFNGLEEALVELDRQSLRLFSIYTPVNLSPQSAPFDPKLDQALPLLKGRSTLLWTYIPRPRNASLSDSQMDQRAIDILRKLSAKIKDYGVSVAIYPHAGFWVETVEHAVRLVKQVDRENVGLTFNLCHWLKVSGPDNMLPLMKEALPHLFSASINGADSGDTKKMNWTQLIQPLDAGTYDTYGFVKALTDLGFQGPIGLQCYNIKAKPEVHLKQSMQAWQIICQRIEADKLLGDL